MVIFSCTCTHTHVMLRYGDLLLHLLTHVMLRYCYVLLHLHTHTSCYVIVIFSCTCSHTSCYVMVIFSCTCLHTSCYAMVIFSCTCTHTSCYVMVVLGWGWVGWGNNVHVNLHTHVMLRFADGNRAWESHAKSLKIKHAKVSHQSKEWTKKMRRTPFFFLSTVAGTQIADRWWKGLKDYIPKSFPTRLYHGVDTKEHPELEKFVLGYCWRKSLGPLTPHRFLEELCKAVKAMKRF